MTCQVCCFSSVLVEMITIFKAHLNGNSAQMWNLKVLSKHQASVKLVSTLRDFYTLGVDQSEPSRSHVSKALIHCLSNLHSVNCGNLIYSPCITVPLLDFLASVHYPL